VLLNRMWLLSVLALYGLLIVALYWMQDVLVFPGASRGGRVPVAPLPRVTVRALSVPDVGEVRMAVAEPTSPPRGVLLHFVGNGEDLRSGSYTAFELSAFGFRAVVPEYPGYGESAGKPGVRSILAMAEAAAAWAADSARTSGVPLLVSGSSLGSFPAMHVTARGGVARLVLRAPLTTLAEIGGARFWFLPVSWILKHGFDNLALAPAVRCPTLVLHGDGDDIVPLRFGTRLSEALGDCRLEVARGFGHNDLPLTADGPFGRLLREFWDGI
jgi:alpha-beta hydrolase superfamily lysophospholipase